jgi:hypothetical protein
MMMKRFLPALLASAALTLTLAACSSPDGNPTSTEDDVATTPLPPLPPPPPDTTGGKKAPAPAPNSVNRELSAPNATEDIKKMQPQM